MLRALVRFIKSPIHTFPALAAAIGCLVSGYSTLNGIAEIFPDFAYSVLAAFGLAAIIQLGMLTSTLTFRERPELRPMLGFIVAVTVLMSSFTSYVFYYRGFSEETIAKERQVERGESLRRYLVDVRAQTAGTLGTLQEAEAELARRIEIEEATGGGLRNLSNPYLQELVGQSDLRIDLGTVKSGTGDRYRFLSSVLPRLQQMQVEVGGALQRLDGELALLAGDDEVDQEALRAVYSRASSVVPVDRIREVRGQFTAPEVDAAILDTRPLEQEEYWQRAVAALVSQGAPSAVVFAFIALFIDLMIVFFAFIAGETQVATTSSRLPVRHWIELAYGPGGADPLRRWLAAMDGARVSRANTVLHRVDLEVLGAPEDRQCGRFLRQDGYLQQVLLEDGEAHWWLTEEAYSGFLAMARAAAEAPGKVAEQPQPAADTV